MTLDNNNLLGALYMNFEEDSFDLDEFNRQCELRCSAQMQMKARYSKNKILNIFVTVSIYILAFISAYLLFIGGQYIINLFR